MAIAIYEATSDGRRYWAESTSKQTQANLGDGRWVLYDATPATPAPSEDPLDVAISERIDDSTSATAARLRAALGSADPVLSDLVYATDGTGNLLSYKEDGIAIVLTYNADGTVATSKRGTAPTKTFTYSSGNLVGVA